MRALLPVLVLCGVMAAVIARSGPFDEKGYAKPRPAKARFDATEASFGRVPYGAIVRHTFRVTNDGERTLSIQGVSPSCGCTVARVSRYALAAGESADIAVVYDTTRKPLAGKSQHLKHTIRVDTNDSIQPTASVLSLSGEVFARYVLDPRVGAMLHSYAAGSGRYPSGTLVKVEPVDGADARSLASARFRSLPRGVGVDGPYLYPDAARPEGVSFTAYPLPEAAPGVLHGTIELETGDRQHPVLRIPIQGAIVAPVTASPRDVYVVRGQRDGALQLRASHDGVAVERVEIAEDGGGPPSVELDADPTGRTLPLALTLRPASDAESGPARGQLRFFVRDAMSPVVEVGYNVVDRSQIDRRTRALQSRGLRVRPVALDLRTYRLGEVEQLAILVTASAQQPIALADVQVTGTDLVSARAEVMREGRAERVMIGVRADRIGAFEGSLSFYPRPGETKVSIPIRGAVAGQLELRPAALFLPLAGRTARAHLSRRDEEPVRVVRVEVPAGLPVTASATPDGSGGWELAVESTSDAPFFGRIALVTDARGEERFEVPVFGGGGT